IAGFGSMTSVTTTQ
ncbi:hypothetical protein A2U01_0087077, partial [Trifolium medium]|nr:hypothetical protein [Trifolium medium]